MLGAPTRVCGECVVDGGGDGGSKTDEERTGTLAAGAGNKRSPRWRELSIRSASARMAHAGERASSCLILIPLQHPHELHLLPERGAGTRRLGRSGDRIPRPWQRCVRASPKRRLKNTRGALLGECVHLLLCQIAAIGCCGQKLLEVIPPLPFKLHKEGLPPPQASRVAHSARSQQAGPPA